MSSLVALDWLVAIAPVLILLLLFEWLDVFHLMGWRETTGVLLLGALAGLSAYPVSGRLLDAMPMGLSGYSRFVAPWIEEALKGIAILFLFARNRIGFKLDAAISGFAVGAGFSVVENAFYLHRFGHLAIGVWMVRGLGTAIMHGATGATFAVAAHQLNERDARRPGVRWRLHPLHYLPGYLVAVAEHVAFNQFPDRPQLAMLTMLVVAPCVVLLVFQIGIREAEGWLEAEAQSHRDALDALRAGRYPSSESGQLVAALADRLSGRAPAEAIRAYLQVQTEIALRAEETLEGRSTGGPFVDARLFERQRALRAQLGRTTLALLAPVLPFSRNELWEMRELERKAGRRDAGRPART